MLGGNSGNPMLPVLLEETSFPYQNNASNQLQLFGNLTAGCINPVNYLGNEQNNSMLQPNNKRSRDAEEIPRQQKLQISLDYNNMFRDEADRSAGIPKQNPVSTGLRLSYDDDERNSTVTSATASGSMTSATPAILSLRDCLKTELDRQKEEFEQYIKVQQEHLLKGMREMKQRHVASFMSALEEGINKKLLEKDIEIENINRKNKELIERVKQVGMEAQSWQCRAKYNESMIHMLKSNLQQAMSQGFDQGKEGFGDSEVDDTASCIDPNSYPSGPGRTGKSIARNYEGLEEHMICRACKAKEVSILLMPCRHLCLCRDCEGFVSVCPVCQLMRSASIQVSLS